MFGDHYKNLKSKKNVKSPLIKITVISDKQKAEKDIDKSRLKNIYLNFIRGMHTFY